MVYIMLTAEKATKLGHDHVTHLEAHRFVLFCFVVLLLILYLSIFQLKFSHKR